MLAFVCACMCACARARAAGSAVGAAADPPVEKLPGLYGSSWIAGKLRRASPPVQGPVFSSLRLLPHRSARALCQASVYHRSVKKNDFYTTSKQKSKPFFTQSYFNAKVAFFLLIAVYRRHYDNNCVFTLLLLGNLETLMIYPNTYDKYDLLHRNVLSWPFVCEDAPSNATAWLLQVSVFVNCYPETLVCLCLCVFSRSGVRFPHAEASVYVWQHHHSSGACRPHSEYLVPASRNGSQGALWGRTQRVSIV